jgi:hypothetical protein
MGKLQTKDDLQREFNDVIEAHAEASERSSRCQEIGDQSGALMHSQEMKRLSDYAASLQGRISQLMWPNDCTGGTVNLGTPQLQPINKCENPPG